MVLSGIAPRKIFIPDELRPKYCKQDSYAAFCEQRESPGREPGLFSICFKDSKLEITHTPSGCCGLEIG
jgi:hypothetical protein